MKNKFSKVLGVVLTVATLTSLLTVATPATPAAAGTLAFTTETGPTTVTVSFREMAVSADGNTIYGVVGTGVLYKSTNGGSTWSTTTVTGTGNFSMVAIAPDDANTVATYNGSAVWICTNGSTTGGSDSWNSAGAPTNVDVARDLTISPSVSGVRQVTVAGSTAGGGTAITTLNLGGTVAVWTAIANGAGPIGAATAPAYAIRYSPNFASDRLLTAVVQNTASVPAGQVTMNLFRFTTLNPVTGAWNAAAGFTDYTGTSNSTGNIGGPFAMPLTTVDLSLAPTYTGTDSASRNAFVAIDDGVTGGVYQLKDVVSKLISDAVRIRSVAFNGTNLVAGRADSNVTYRSSDMLASSPTFTSTTQFQRPGGGVGAVASNTLVAWAGVNAVAATSGNGSAFSRSTDNGANYQDVSNWNTSAASNVTDIAVAPDGSKWYMVTTGNGTDTNVNVWSKTGTTWERLMFIANPASSTFTLRIAPDNKLVVYLVQNGSTNIYYTDDGGDKNWVLRIANDNVLDLAVESAQVVYYTYASNVRKSTNGGFLWNDPATSISSTWGTSFAIKSLGKDNLLVTSTAGKVAWSTNGGTSFTSAATLTNGGALQATAGNLSSGTFVYAAPGAGNTLGAGVVQIYRYKIGSVAPDNVWKAITGNTVATTPTATALFNGLELVGGNSGILYAISQDPAGPGSTLWRTMNPAEAGETSVVFSALLTGPTLATSLDASLVNGRTTDFEYSVASGVNTIWVIDADTVVSEEAGDSATTINDEIYSFNDTLSAVPTTLTPAANAVIPVNPVSGNTFFVTFTWNRPSLATSYDWQVATDKDFKAVISNNVNFAPADPAVSPVAANLLAGATLNPGTTYYFRMRTNLPLFSPWSATTTFSTASLDKPFGIAGPAVGSTDVPVQPVLSWTAYPGALWYEVTVSEDPSFAIPEFSHNVKGNLFYGVTADEALKNSTTYYWRVRGVTAEPFVQGSKVVTPSGPWSTGAFTTVAAAPAAQPPTVITVPAPAPPAQVIQLPAPPPEQIPAAIPNWMLMTIIIIGAVLVIALVILIVRTRRVA